MKVIRIAGYESKFDVALVGAQPVITMTNDAPTVAAFNCIGTAGTAGSAGSACGTFGSAGSVGTFGCSTV